MLISMNWINDFVDLSGLDLPKLIHQFTLSTAEVEDVYTMGADIQDVVVAKILSVVALVWIFVTMLIAMVRLIAEKGWVKDLVRHIISLIMALVVCYVLFSLRATLTKPQYLLVILAALLTIAQIVIDVILIRKANKKEVEDAKEEAMQGFHTEEYAEAYAYEGGPVAGVLMAEEINPSFLPHEPHVNTRLRFLQLQEF